MEITPIGWILIPLGVLLLSRPKWLYVLAVFFTPFTATAILNRGSGESAAGIQPYLYFGTMLFLRKGFDLTYSLRFKLLRSTRRPLLIYLCFVGVCVVSVAMPFIIDGRTEVLSNGTLEATLVPIQFGAKNVSALISLIYGFLFTVLVVRESMPESQFLRTLRIYMASGLFVSFWGFLQFGLGLINVPYPYQVFNNNASPYAQLGGTMSLLHVVRISSVAMEPSAFALILVGMFAIQLMAVQTKRYIFGRRIDRIALVVFFAALMLTGSGTGYIGFLSTCLMGYISFMRGKKKVIRRSLLLLAAAGLFVGLLFALPPTRLYMQEAIFSKADSVSALERGTIILADLKYFLTYPVLGIGWGTAPAHDLTMGILANAGLLGLIAFLSFIGDLIFKLLRLGKTSATGSSVMLVPLVATLISYALDSMPAGGTFALLMGLAIAETSLLAQIGSLDPFPRARKLRQPQQRLEGALDDPAPSL